MVDGWHVPDENDEYFFYQTLVGAWPFQDTEGFVQTLKEHIICVMRDYRWHCAAGGSNAAYERATLGFIDAILNPAGEGLFLQQFLPFQKRVAFYGIFNALSQVLIKATAPGVPDFYQGSELWDLSLAQGHAPLPVDFAQRVRLLRELTAQADVDILKLAAELCSTREDGRIKLFLINRLLQARQQHADLFRTGGYIPLTVSGRYSGCVMAYARCHSSAWALCLAPRFLTKLVKEDELPCGLDVWKDTAVALPEGAPARWQDSITNQSLGCGSLLQIGEAFKYFPAALLMSSGR